MSLRKPDVKRFALAVVLVALVAGAVVSAAAALRFDDSSYLTPEGVVGTPYTHRFTAPPAGGGGAGCDPPYFVKVDSGAFPPGLSLATDGWVSGTPTQAGSWSFYVSIKDDPTDKPWCNPMSAEREFTIRIIDRLRIGPESAAPGTVGVTYSLPMTGTLSDPKTWSISQGALPPGLTLGSSDGLIAGTPTSAGSYSFTVLAAVDSKRSDTKALTILIRDPLSVVAEEPFDGATHVARGELGIAFRAPLAARGGSGTYAWSVTSGALPPGIALSADGTISGRPTAVGIYRFRASATDTEGRAASYDATLSVAARLAIATQALRPARVGRPYRARLAATGGVNPKTWSKRGQLPRGLRLAASLGELRGTPRTPGRYRIALKVVDALGVRSKRTFALIVAPSSG